MVKRKKVFGFLLAVIMISTITILPMRMALSAPNNEPKHAPDRLLIKFKQDIPEYVQQAILRNHEAQVADEISQIDVKILKVPEKALDRIESALKANTAVEYVQEDFLYERAMVPNDPLYSSQWHLSKINMPQAWDITKGNTDVKIAILDGGVRFDHPDLADKNGGLYNFYDGSDPVLTNCGHGTVVAGSAGATTNNAIGVAGVAWNNKLVSMRVTDANCNAFSSAMAKAMVYAADNGVKVVNLSYALLSDATFLNAAQYVNEHGGIVVASGGNWNQYFAYDGSPYVIYVSGTDVYDSADGVSYGPYIDFAAPRTVYTTCMCTVVTSSGSYTSYYTSASGTSVSAPQVAGLIALIFSINPTLTPQQVYDILKQSAVDLGTAGYDDHYGWGRIDAYKALQLAVGNNATSSNIVSIDTIPPSVSVTSPADGSTISGNINISVNATDNVGISKVELYVDGSVFSQDLSSPFSFTIDTTKLSNGSHTLIAKAYDTSGNAASSQISVSVSNVIADTSPPSVSVTNPADGSTISGNINISVNATDNVGISKVDLYVDNVLYGESTVKPYNFVLDTTKLSNGGHTSKAVAYDTSGNAASSQISVSVSNVIADTTPPSVSITNPPDGSIISGKVSISVSASDTSGISKVELYIDGVLQTKWSNGPYTVTWNTRTVADGPHAIAAKAYDTNGNSASASIDVNVTNRRK